MDAYTIGQLARAVNVPTSTLRFYERSGLLKPDYRTGGNYRGYTERALERLRFIRSAQATGLSLKDISTLFGLADSSAPVCDDVMDLMRRRLAEIRTRVQELQHVERVLAGTVARCCKGDSPDICTEIHRLNGITCKPTKKKSAVRASPCT